MKNRNRRDELLRRLGVDRKYLADQAEITPMLRRCGIKDSRVIEILCGYDNGAAQTVVALYRSLTPANQRIIGLDALAVAAGLTPIRLYGLYSEANLLQAHQSVGNMIADELPAIMRVTLKNAKTPLGGLSREHIFKAARVLPTPKGSVINIGMPQKQELEDDDDFEDLEPADEFMIRASTSMGVKQLPAPQNLEPEGDEEDDE